MHELTGDREFVLQLLKDTIDNLSVKPPQTKSAVAKKTSAAEAKADAERDEAIERLQRAYERAQQLEPVQKTGKAAGKSVVEEPWYAPRDRALALIQSAMDEYLEEKANQQPAAKSAKKAAKKGAEQDESVAQLPEEQAKNAFYKAKPATTGATTAVSAKMTPKAAAKSAKALMEEQYDKLDPGWLKIGKEQIKLLFKGKRKFIKHKSLTDFRFKLADQAKIALVSDWGGGNNHAIHVAAQIRAHNPDHVIHLGDVYYSGTEKEVRERFLKYWPAPPAPGRSFSLNSNHEMYSGGYGYFNVILKQFKQPASYFSLANDNWRFIGLDTGYIEHNLNAEQVEWLAAQLNDGAAKNILLSHHQLFSAYESGGGGEERLERWLSPFLTSGKVTGWYWGHEHLCVVYKPYKGIKGRCIGNGCFPYSLPPIQPPFPGPQVEWVDRRPDPTLPKRGMHSFALLSIDGPRMHVDYIDQDGVVAYAEDF
jgi:hypothetical protein